MSKAHKVKRLLRLLKGLIVEWSVVDPLSESEDSDLHNTQISHRNFVAYQLINENITGLTDIIQNATHKWEVTISIHFRNDDGGVEVVERVMRESMAFSCFNNSIALNIEDVFETADMTKYIDTHMKAEILG